MKLHKMKKAKSYITLRQRITAAFMVAVLLLQICVPTVALAATAWGSQAEFNRQIQLQLESGLFSAMENSSADEAYKGAFYLFQDAQPTKNLLDFYREYNGVNDSPVIKQVGDTFVQTRLIRSQIKALLGRFLIQESIAPLTVYAAEAEKINDLYAQGIRYGKAPESTGGSKLPLGTPLPEGTSVTADMIWPEVRTINNKSVLIPVVYLSKPEERAVNGHDINLFGDTEFASITLDKDILLNGYNNTIVGINGIINGGGKIESSGNLTLISSGTIANLGGVFSATENLKIVAEDFYNKTLVVPYKDKNGEGTKVGSVASITGGSIEIVAADGITFEGASAISTEGTLTLNAENNINILPVTTQNNSQSQQGDWKVNKSTTDLLMSRLAAEDTLSLIAGGVITITASELISTSGGIELLAGQGIFIEDGTESEQQVGVDKKGKTTGQSSEFRTEAVRALLKAGKNIRLESDVGNIKLKAVDITSADGTSVIAKNGAVQLLTTTELEERHLQTVRKGTWTIKTRTEDIVHETKLQNVIVGGLQVEATGGIEIEYVGDPKKETLKGQLDTFAKMPGLSWMAEIYNSCLVANKTEADITGIVESTLLDIVDPSTITNTQGDSPCDGQKISWSKVEEIHKEIRKTKRSLSPAAMALVAIAITIATSGAGAGALAGGSTQITLGSVAQAAMGAGLTAIEIQVASSLLAGNSLDTTIRSLDDDEFVNSLATAMVTAGAMHAMPDFKLFPVGDATGWTKSALEFGNQATNAVARSAIQSSVSVYIQGGNSKDYLRAFNSALASNAINTIGTNLHGKIANANWDTALNYISHAALGCAAGALTNKLQDTDVENGCVSGAGGAVITEAITANLMDSKIKEFANKVKNEGAIWPELEDKLTEFRKLGIDISRLAAAFTAFALKGDVNAAASSAEKVARANVYKAVDMIEIYKEVNGEASTDPQRKERIKEKYKERVRAALEDAGIDPATIDSLIAKMSSNNVFESAAIFEDERIGDGRNIEATVNARAKDSFDLPQEEGDGTANPDVLTEVKTIGAPFSQIVGLSLDFLGATNRTINVLTPGEREVVGIAFNVITGGPLKTGLGYALSIGMDKILPAELSNQIANAPVYLGTAGIGFLTSSNYENTKDYYDHPANDPDLAYDINEWVDGLTWLASNVIGLPGAKGTNTSNSIYVNGNQHGNNVHYEFGRTHHFWPSLDALYNDLKSAPVRISVMGKFHNYKEDDFIKYNDGKLGEAVMLDVLEGTTGKKFTPMQNLSGHGPDGVYIDPVTKTIYLAEAKSSVNGADKAVPPTGSPTARLNQWMTDYQDGKYDNADPATLNKFRELQQIYESSGATPSIKGVWVQVEVPKFNSSNFTGVETIVSAWN